MSLRLIWSVAIGLVLISAAFGQGVIYNGAAAGSGFSGAFTTAVPPPFAISAVTGAAYSGEEVTERVQTLADGTHITQTFPGRHIYRDSMGRTRSERPLMVGSHASESPMIVEITDPVAGFQYTLDPQKKVAHRFAVPSPTPGQGGRFAARPLPAIVRSGELTAVIGTAPPPPPPSPGTTTSVTSARIATPRVDDGRPRPEFKNESLGTQSIDGLLCEGRRTTTTFPVDSFGNDRPVVVIEESWTSPELKTIILSKANDPRSGENTFEIRNLSRTEPDASLFQPPPDYSVVDESGSVTISFGK